MKYAAIDPGNNGAAVLMEYSEVLGHRCVKALDMPTMLEQLSKGGATKRKPDFEQLLALFYEISEFQPKFVILERQWARAGDSAQTAFTLGGWYELLRVLLHTHGYAHNPINHSGYYHQRNDESYTLITPNKWKQWQPYKQYGLYGSGDDSKRIAIEMFKDIFPGDYADHRLQVLYKNSSTRWRLPFDGRADAALMGLYGACELFGLPLPLALEPELITAQGKCVLF